MITGVNQEGKEMITSSVHGVLKIKYKHNRSGSTTWTDITFIDSNGIEVLEISAFGRNGLHPEISEKEIKIDN